MYAIINFEMKKEPHQNKESKKAPHGREAVRKAILDAAEKLLLERSPSEITVREIAELAKVKHPLIYRHFGTKDQVIIEVHTRGIDKVNKSIPIVENLEGNIGTYFKGVIGNKWRHIALARAMIDGVSPHLIQNQFPVMQRLVKLMKKKHEKGDGNDKFSPEFLTASLAALALGWMLYEPFLLAAIDAEDENREEIHQKVVEILEEFLKKVC